MNLSLHKLTKYGFNRRELTEADFYRICEKEGVFVIEMNVAKSFHFSAGGVKFIVLNKKLKGLRRLFDMFHELAHYFLHGGDDEYAFFHGLTDDKAEREADAVALMAMIPAGRIGCFEFLNDHPNRFAKKLWKDRQRLFFLYGI